MNKKLTLLLGLITVMPGLQAAAEQKEKPLEALHISRRYNRLLYGEELLIRFNF